MKDWDMLSVQIHTEEVDNSARMVLEVSVDVKLSLLQKPLT